MADLRLLRCHPTIQRGEGGIADQQADSTESDGEQNAGHWSRVVNFINNSMDRGDLGPPLRINRSEQRSGGPACESDQCEQTTDRAYYPSWWHLGHPPAQDHT